MKTLISAKRVREYAQDKNMSPKDWAAVCDVWMPLANQYHLALAGKVEESSLIKSVVESVGEHRDLMKIAKRFVRLVKEEHPDTDLRSLFNDNMIILVTIDGVVAINSKLHEFKPDWLIELSPEYTLKAASCESGVVGMDAIMDIVYRSRTYGSGNLTPSRIGCECEVHTLAATLLNEINPVIDGLLENLEPHQSLIYTFTGGNIAVKVVS